MGAEQEIAVDVRVLCATLRDLKGEIKAGRFREDLYHRIGGFPIYIPPLRERIDDIPLLAAHFLREFVAEGRCVPEIEPEAMERLCQYPWPGNVRELKNVLERAVLLSEGRAIRPSLCPEPLSASGREWERFYDLPLHEACDRFTKDYLRRLLDRYGGDTQKMADHAGVHVTTIRHKLRELGVVFKASTLKQGHSH